MIIVENFNLVTLVRSGVVFTCVYGDIDWSAEYELIAEQIISLDRIRLEKLGDEYLLDFDGGTLS